MTFKSQDAHDRVDDGAKVVYTSPRPGPPPVCTTLWEPQDWMNWEAACTRVRFLQIEAEAAGYTVVAI